MSKQNYWVSFNILMSWTLKWKEEREKGKGREEKICEHAVKQIFQVKFFKFLEEKVTTFVLQRLYFGKNNQGKGGLLDKYATFNLKSVVHWLLFYKPLWMKSLKEQ